MAGVYTGCQISARASFQTLNHVCSKIYQHVLALFFELLSNFVYINVCVCACFCVCACVCMCVCVCVFVCVRCVCVCVRVSVCKFV